MDRVESFKRAVKALSALEDTPIPTVILGRMITDVAEALREASGDLTERDSGVVP
jgi:hypothetical protein